MDDFIKMILLFDALDEEEAEKKKKESEQTNIWDLTDSKKKKDNDDSNF